MRAHTRTRAHTTPQLCRSSCRGPRKRHRQGFCCRKGYTAPCLAKAALVWPILTDLLQNQKWGPMNAPTDSCVCVCAHAHAFVAQFRLFFLPPSLGGWILPYFCLLFPNPREFTRWVPPCVVVTTAQAASGFSSPCKQTQACMSRVLPGSGPLHSLLGR